MPTTGPLAAWNPFSLSGVSDEQMNTLLAGWPDQAERGMGADVGGARGGLFDPSIMLPELGFEPGLRPPTGPGQGPLRDTPQSAMQAFLLGFQPQMRAEMNGEGNLLMRLLGFTGNENELSAIQGKFQGLGGPGQLGSEALFSQPWQGQPGVIRELGGGGEMDPLAEGLGTVTGQLGQVQQAQKMFGHLFEPSEAERATGPGIEGATTPGVPTPGMEGISGLATEVPLSDFPLGDEGMLATQVPSLATQVPDTFTGTLGGGGEFTGQGYGGELDFSGGELGTGADQFGGGGGLSFAGAGSALLGGAGQFLNMLNDPNATDAQKAAAGAKLAAQFGRGATSGMGQTAGAIGLGVGTAADVAMTATDPTLSDTEKSIIAGTQVTDAILNAFGMPAYGTAIASGVARDTDAEDIAVQAVLGSIPFFGSYLGQIYSDLDARGSYAAKRAFQQKALQHFLPRFGEAVGSTRTMGELNEALLGFSPTGPYAPDTSLGGYDPAGGGPGLAGLTDPSMLNLQVLARHAGTPEIDQYATDFVRQQARLIDLQDQFGPIAALQGMSLTDLLGRGGRGDLAALLAPPPIPWTELSRQWSAPGGIYGPGLPEESVIDEYGYRRTPLEMQGQA